MRLTFQLGKKPLNGKKENKKKGREN